MTHFRRYEFKKRRYCSTPAVANLHDFSDNFVEELKVSLININRNISRKYLVFNFLFSFLFFTRTRLKWSNQVA